jgi:hypothetical protein
MKKWFLLAATALLLLGQTNTRIDPGRQVRPECPGATGPTVYMNNGSGTMICAGIDGVSLKLVNGVLTASSQGAAAPTWVNETLAGTSDGTNAVFTMSFPPAPGSPLIISVGGMLQTQAPQPTGPTDFSVNGQTVTFATAAVPAAGISPRALYQHQ